MGFLDIFKKRDDPQDEYQLTEEHNGKDKDTINTIGVFTSISATTAQTIKEANIKFSKPNYNPETRTQYYDNGVKHRLIKEQAFSDGAKVYDPYTNKELLLKVRDAKIKYGDNWQSHLAEADHIDPLHQFVNRNIDNPFLTTDNMREIANADDNFQVMSRTLNQSSKDVGKGGLSQEEWANDSRRMDGLSEHIESGESIDEVRQRIVDTGRDAVKRNDLRARCKGVQNAIDTAHKAGVKGAQNAGISSLTISGIMNVVSVIKGEKTTDEAILDTAKDAGNAAVMGYATSGGLTVFSQALSNTESEFIRGLVNSNVPAKIITAVVITGDTLKQWCDGEITTEQCIIQLGDKGLNMATIGYSMAVGQTLIPIPIVGGAVGALVGSMLTSSLYNGLITDLQNRQLAHEERLRLINQYEEIAEQARNYRIELENYLNEYFADYKNCFDTALSTMKVAYAMKDTDAIIASANEITEKLGGRVAYNNFDEFNDFLDSDEVDCL